MTVPIRRLPLDVGDAAELPVITVDVDTLAVAVEQRRYERLGERHWRHVRRDVTQHADEFDVDEHGVVIDRPGRFRRRP